MDFISGLLTVLDRFSNMPYFRVLPKLPSSKETEEAVLLYVFHLHGLTQDIVLVLSFLKEILQVAGSVSQSLLGFPQSDINSQTERYVDRTPVYHLLDPLQSGTPSQNSLLWHQGSFTVPLLLRVPTATFPRVGGGGLCFVGPVTGSLLLYYLEEASSSPIWARKSVFWLSLLTCQSRESIVSWIPGWCGLSRFQQSCSSAPSAFLEENTLQLPSF